MNTSVFIIGIEGRVAQRHKLAWGRLGVSVSGCGSDMDYREIISKNRFDIIDICTPIYLHPIMIKESIKYASVICEKPLGINIEEAKEITRIAGKVCIVYQFRFNPKILKLKREIQEGKYGEIKMVTANYFRWRGEEYYKKWEADKFKAGGGVLLNVCIHYVDLLQWMFGYPTKVCGTMTTAKTRLDVEDCVSMSLKFPTGAIGTLNLSTHVNPPKHFELSVYGTKGHTTIQLRQNEYHYDNFKAFLEGHDYVTPMEAMKSLQICEDFYNNAQC
jgi:UDP-N-acetyl-2-amino-2-deoxyglucuronate dehydrogenase